jgi:nitric oxide reductase activation protein
LQDADAEEGLVQQQHCVAKEAEEQETAEKQKKTAAKVESRLKKISELNKLMAARERQAWDDHGSWF